MVPDKDRYFIAIVPPSPLFDQALELKNYLRDQYQSKASLNSPPHITLHMPFEWKAEKESELVEALQQLSGSLKTVRIELKNFGCFPPRVIFIHITPSTDLGELQKHVRRFCKKELGLFNADYKDLPFHPHITVAFRDLKNQAFAEAWNEFKEKEFEGSFMASSITLLKFVEKKWAVTKEFPLSN
jgi:2'-5' RNA ligase